MTGFAKLQKLLKTFKEKAQQNIFSPLIVGGYKLNRDGTLSADRLKSPLNNIESLQADHSLGFLVTNKIFVTDIQTALNDPKLLPDLILLWEPVLSRLIKMKSKQVQGLFSLSSAWAKCYQEIDQNELAWWMGEIVKIKEEFSNCKVEATQSVERLSDAPLPLIPVRPESSSSSVVINFSYASQIFIQDNTSYITLRPEEQERLAAMLRRFEYSQIFESYLEQIKQDHELATYFRKMQRYLDNTVGACKSISSGLIEGTNTTKEWGSYIEQALQGVFSFTLGPLAGMAVSIIAFALGTANENNIRLLATRVATLFPNSSEYGAILEALALIMTVHQAHFIRNQPPLSSLNPLYKMYLTAAAKYNGESSFSALDLLALNQAKLIVEFWFKLPESTFLLEQWLPPLLEEFKIKLPATIEPAHIGKPIMASANTTNMQRAAIAATSEAVTANGTGSLAAALQVEVQKLRQEVELLKSSARPDSTVYVEGLEVNASSSQSLVYLKRPDPEVESTRRALREKEEQMAILAQELLAQKEEKEGISARLDNLENRFEKKANPPPSSANTSCVVC